MGDEEEDKEWDRKGRIGNTKEYKGIQRKKQAATDLLVLTRLLAVSTLLHYD